jgi:hypothetical protein
MSGAGPQALAELRLEAELVALSQISQAEMTLAQAERIHQLEDEMEISQSMASQVPTPRRILASVLNMEVVSWDWRVPKTEYPEKCDGWEHLQ